VKTHPSPDACCLPFTKLYFIFGMILLWSSIPCPLNRPLVLARTPAVTADSRQFLVATIEDGGAGSLRNAIEMANAHGGPAVIHFDAHEGPFADPQTLVLDRPLPALTGELTIDGYIPGRLWQPSGVTLSGEDEQRVFSIAPGAEVTLSSLSIARGRASCGGGVFNRGHLIVKSVTFIENRSNADGGAICNQAGSVHVINSTFAGNAAQHAGGALANLDGRAIVTNCTFSANTSGRPGGGIFSRGYLLLRNSIVADSHGEADCLAEGIFDQAGSHNLIESHSGCGQPISTADPRLGRLGGYNGPTPTIPLGSGSPAINLGDNASALDENGAPLKWDQRGNGDPRYVAGITDIGAFEHQMLPTLVVDTAEDIDLRACTRAGVADCSLRGAITLANAMGKPQTITFDSHVFSHQAMLTLVRPLPTISTDLTIGRGEARMIRILGDAPVFRTRDEHRLILKGITAEHIR